MKKLFKALFDRYFILLLLIVSIVYWKWWIPGIRVANDFPTIPIGDIKAQFNIPSVWFLRGSVGLGGYSVFTLWSWPIDFIAGMFANLGFTIEILERLMLVIPIILIGIFSIWNLLSQFQLSKISKFIASLFYLTNTYILLLIDGGQLAIGLAFAWFPTAYLLFEKSVEGGVKKKILAGFGLWILGILDIRFVYVLAILLTFRFICSFVSLSKSERTVFITSWLKAILITSIVFIGINFYWILPFIKFPLSETRASDLTRNSNLNFTQLKHSVSLLQPHWYENIFGKIAPFRKEFLLIPILAFLAPILRSKNKNVWFWTVIAATSVFLAKGANPPLPSVYPWLFENVPGFSLFRDSTKFFFLVALSYSILIAFTVDSIGEKLPKFKFLFAGLIAAYLLILIYPVYTGKMTGTFSEARYEKQYQELANKIESDKKFGRVFWIPSRAPLGHASILHSSLEANRLESLRPFAISTVGTYETQNFIREGNYMGEMFDITGIKYLSYPYFDPKRDDMSKDKLDYYKSFLNQIEGLPWIKEKINDFPVPVFETQKNQEKLFPVQNTYFVIGSDRIYSEIKSLGANFSNNALIFVEENRELLDQIEKTSLAKVILYDKSITDLVLSFANKDKYISVSDGLGGSPNETGWWKREATDIVWLRDFLQTKYGIDNLDFDYESGWAIAEGEKELQIESKMTTKGNVIFARVMQSSKSGEVDFYQTDMLLGSVVTKIEKPEKVSIKLTGNSEIPDSINKYDKADFHWVRVGEIPEEGAITIKTKGDINIVNALVILSQSEENELNLKTGLLIEEGRVLEWNKLNTDKKKSLLVGKNNAKVSYQILAPTHYKVKVEGLASPTTLFFSEIFDPGWELNSQKGYKLFSFINGFWVERDGEYDLYFTPQKYVIPGLVISIITLSSCIMILIWRKTNSAQLSKKSS